MTTASDHKAAAGPRRASVSASTSVAATRRGGGHDTADGAFDYDADAARRQQRARGRWRLLQTHVRVTRRVSQELAHKHARRFVAAQQALAAASASGGLLDTLLAVREQLLALLDAQHCVLSFQASCGVSGAPAAVEFDGRALRHEPSASAPGREAARRRARTDAHEPTFLSSAAACAHERVQHAATGGDVRSYLCLPLVDRRGRVQAVAELLNARHDASRIAAWLGDCDAECSLAFRSASASSEPLRVFCGFVGGLLRACAPVETLLSDASSSSSSETSSRSASGDSSELLAQLTLLQKALGVQHWALYSLDRDAQTLWTHVGSSRDALRGRPASVALGHGVIGRAASTGEPLLDGDVLCVPTLARAPEHAVNGVVVLHSRSASASGARCAAFRQADVALGSAVGRHVGAALQRLALREARDKAQDKAQTLLELSELVFRELERAPKPAALLLAVARALAATAWLRVADCSVYLKDAATRELFSPGSAVQGEYRVPLSAASATAVAAARSGGVVNVQAADASPCRDKRSRPSSVLAMPIKDASGAVLGVLELLHEKPRAHADAAHADEAAVRLAKPFFDTQDEQLVCGVARHAALALRNAQRLDAARAAQRKSAALLSLRLPAATGTLPGEQAGAVFAAAEAAVCRALRAAHGALFLVDAPSRSLFARVGADWRGYSLPLGQRLQGRVAATGAAVRLAREARAHPEFDREYDQAVGMQTASLLCVPIKAQPSLAASMSSCASSRSSRAGRRCSSSFSTGSSTDDEADDRPVLAVFYAANKLSTSDEPEGFDAEDELVLRAICAELAALVERRAWELVFESPAYDGSDSSDSDGDAHVTRTFLSQYTTKSPSQRRRRPRSRAPSVASEHDHAAAVVAATSFHEGCFLSSSGGCGILGPLAGGLSASVTGSGGVESPVLQWGLDPWEFSPAQLLDLAVDMFALHDLLDGFALPEATLRRFLHSVQTQYRDVPYHNTYHAFATLHMSFLLLTAQSRSLSGSLVPASKPPGSGKDRRKRCGELLLSPRERLAVFVAAFAHDMGHDARTNDFHVRRASKLARRYNDQSVLENMHAAACFETMRRPGHDVFAGVAESAGSSASGTRRALRKRVIRAILATDMHCHAGIVVKLLDAQARGGLSDPNGDDETMRELLVNAVVHAADISGPTQNCAAHLHWTKRLLEEFNQQHDEEKALGLTPTAFMDASPDAPEFSRVNLAFVDSCAFPLWRALSGLLSGLDGCLANLQRNRSMWATRLEKASKHQPQDDEQAETPNRDVNTAKDVPTTSKTVSTPPKIPLAVSKSVSTASKGTSDGPRASNDARPASRESPSPGRASNGVPMASKTESMVPKRVATASKGTSDGPRASNDARPASRESPSPGRTSKVVCVATRDAPSVGRVSNDVRTAPKNGSTPSRDIQGAARDLPTATRDVRDVSKDARTAARGAPTPAMDIPRRSGRQMHGSR